MIQHLFQENKYNSYIANKFGLEAAVYLSTVISYQKNYAFGSERFTLDRDFITEQTTLSFDAQKNIDDVFIKIGVFSFELDNTLHIHYDKYLALFDVANEKVLLDIVPKLTKKRTKSDVIKEELKNLIKTDNVELRDAYSAWIDAVFAKQGWMSKKSVELGQKLIDSFSGRNLDLAIEILNIASIGGYRDIQWAINSYKENISKHISLPVASTSTITKVNLSQEVF